MTKRVYALIGLSLFAVLAAYIGWYIHTRWMEILATVCAAGFLCLATIAWRRGPLP